MGNPARRMTRANFRAMALALSKEILAITWALFRVIIPILIVIKILQELGVIQVLARWLSPLMGCTNA